MRYRFLIILLLFIILVNNNLYPEIIISREDEKIYDEIFFYLENNPIDINSSPLDSLLLIPHMDRISAEKIFNGRPYQSVEEALILAGFAETDIEYIGNFLIISSKPHFLENYKLILTSYFKYREYSDENFKRQPFKIKNEIDIFYNSITLSACLEQDPGELVFPDMVNVYLQYNAGSIQYILGTQSLKAGTGLLLGREEFGLRLHPSKSFNIKGYSGGIELGNPIGFSVLKTSSSYRLGAFGGIRYYDGILDSAGNVISIHTDGYHTNDLSLYRKHNFRIDELDFMLSIDNLNSSVILNLSKYSRNLLLYDSTFIKNLIGYEYILKYNNENIDIILDAAKFNPGSYGFYFGILSKYKRNKILTSFYHYEKKLISPLSFPPGEFSGYNEEGIYINVSNSWNKWKLLSFVNFSREIYTDSTSNPWKRELTTTLENKFVNTYKISLKLSHKANSGYSPSFPGIQPTRNQLTLTLKSDWLKFCYYKCLATDRNFYQTGDAMVFQNTFNIISTDITCFYANYRTTSYASRIYIYLPEVPKTINFINASGSGNILRIIIKHQFEDVDIIAFADIHRENNYMGLFINAEFN